MFKTIYSKYLFTFTVLLAVGFLTVGLIISSIVSDYSVKTKSEIMANTSKAAYEILLGMMDEREATYSEILERSPQYISKSLENFSEISESSIVFASPGGRLLLTVGDSSQILEQKIPDTVMQNIIMGNTSIYSFDDLDGFFAKKSVNYIRLVHKEGEFCGIIVVSSPSTLLESAVNQTSNALVLCCIWVFVAAMVVLFFVSQKISEPLKELIRAAKDFSVGRYDTRVKVKGSSDIAQVAEAFNNMASSVERAEENRREFIGNVSHDLRTPMTSIQGFVDGILSGAIPQEKHNHYLTVVSSEVKRLARLVNSLLDITKLQAGEKKFVMAPFDVSETLRLILISFEEKINNKKIEIYFDCDDEKALVYGDADSIHQVAYNLIDNAIKFTNEGGEIKVGVHRADKKYHISVYNTGEGISQENIEHVFERFYKEDRSRGIDKTGVGLGLFIVKTIIEAHGEKISVKSKHGKDCEFSFTLTPATSTQISAAKKKR